MSIQTYIAGFALALLSTAAFAGETVKAPRGWDDQYEGQIRVISNGNSTIRIAPWEDLHGVSIEQWLTDIEQQDPKGGQLISSEGVKTESVPGAFSALRKAQFDDEKGYAVLYGCPGQTGHARLMTLDVRDGGFFDLLKGAKFGENVCKNEPKGIGSGANPGTSEKRRLIGPGAVFVETQTAGKAISDKEQERFKTITDDELKVLNQQIPADNRPIGANKYSDWGFFGGMYSLKIRFTLLFNNGIETRCVNWDPAGNFPNAEELASSRCKFPNDELLGKVRGFKPGERVEVNYRTYEQLNSYDFGDNVAYQSIGGSLQLNLDGTIGNSRSSQSYQGTADATAASGRNTTLAGRYYLNGHTVTIFTDQGDVIHSYIGFDVDDNGKMSRIYYNGSMFWDWKKDK